MIDGRGANAVGERVMTKPYIAIACGGTGGHLFPGVAIAEEYLDYDVDVCLIVRSGDVDRFGVSVLSGVEVHEIPGTEFKKNRPIRSIRELIQNHQAVRAVFRERRPTATLGMGGYSSFSPIRLTRAMGGVCFMHEANSVPGRSVRLLAKKCHTVYTFFDQARKRIAASGVQAKRVGMPLRRQFEKFDAPSSRVQLGLRRDRPTLLVMGGSQGARPINRFVVDSLERFLQAIPNLQIVHLTGSLDFDWVRERYKKVKAPVIVRPFLTEIEFAYAAANVVLMRSGASALAEIVRMRIPNLLVPLPHAADNHQYYNAKAFADSGAGAMIEQSELNSDATIQAIRQSVFDSEYCQTMVANMDAWDAPEAANTIVCDTLTALGIEPKRKSPLIRFD